MDWHLAMKELTAGVLRSRAAGVEAEENAAAAAERETLEKQRESALREATEMAQRVKVIFRLF